MQGCVLPRGSTKTPHIDPNDFFTALIYEAPFKLSFLPGQRRMIRGRRRNGARNHRECPKTDSNISSRIPCQPALLRMAA
jgi:hypothetical protein